MKKQTAHFVLTAAIILIGSIASRSCSAEGFNNRGGFTNNSGEIQYWHGNDGSHGWQDKGGGGSYYHGSDKSCFTNEFSGGNSYTHCHSWE